MPSIVSHTVVGLAGGSIFPVKNLPQRFWVLSIICPVLPDADSINFSFGIPYGGLGIALLSPFDTTRYFFPWQPIQVSPIGIAAFFSLWGLRVIMSEIIWVWLPSISLVILVKLFRFKKPEA